MRLKVGAGRDPIEWILIAKCIGILLVVAGHFDPESAPDYWFRFKDIIYLFHIPLFFILSGYLYSHGKYSYGALIRNKTKRLLYPFFTIAAVMLLVKIIAARVVTLEHPVEIGSIYTLLTNPLDSYIPLLWFIQALFLIFVIYPLARTFLNNYLILLILLVMNSVLGNDYPVLGNAIACMPFFVVGAMLRENKKLSALAIRADWRNILVPVALFVLVYETQDSINLEYLHGYPARLVLGILGSFAAIGVSTVLAGYPAGKLKDVLLQIGYYSMTIYLLHTIFESTVRIAFSQVFKNSQVPFEVIAVLAISSGIVFPLVLEKEVFRRFWLTRKFMLGLS